MQGAKNFARYYESEIQDYYIALLETEGIGSETG
jgi:hypothetical protein